MFKKLPGMLPPTGGRLGVNVSGINLSKDFNLEKNLNKCKQSRYSTHKSFVR